MVDLLPLSRPHEDPSLAGLFGQAIVDVRDDGEGSTLWVAEAHVDPVISETQQGKLHWYSTDVTFRVNINSTCMILCEHISGK